jgi:hypothetical protein
MGKAKKMKYVIKELNELKSKNKVAYNLYRDIVQNPSLYLLRVEQIENVIELIERELSINGDQMPS